MDLVGKNASIILEKSAHSRQNLASAITEIQRTRAGMTEIFAPPSTQHLHWNILLLVAGNHLANKKTIVSDIYTLNMSSKSTVISAINKLTTSGMLHLVSDNRDRRAKNVLLDDNAFASILTLLSSHMNNLGTLLRAPA